jgi:hypothetical protein
MGNTEIDVIKPLWTYHRSRTITESSIHCVFSKLNPSIHVPNLSKIELLLLLEKYRTENGYTNSELCDAFAEAIYLPLLKGKTQAVPDKYKYLLS